MLSKDSFLQNSNRITKKKTLRKSISIKHALFTDTMEAPSILAEIDSEGVLMHIFFLIRYQCFIGITIKS